MLTAVLVLATPAAVQAQFNYTVTNQTVTIIKAPDWDVHACFDAVFILRQLGGETEPVRKAMEKAGDWALSCRNEDGGFGHYPGSHSDMDAVYFQFGTLLQCGWVAAAKRDLPDAHTLSWGHAMQPGKLYD